MRIVSNASPLIFLGKIDLLGLLQQCFQETLVPPGVVAEVGIDLPRFIEQRSLSEFGEAYVSGAMGRLHRGELEALLLAREQKVEVVALDDRPARLRAAQMALKPIGTLGLLLLFQRRGLLGAIEAREKLDQLVHHHGLYLSDKLLEQARRTLATAPEDQGANR
jgi:predicted nucleic acid-binding protein